jgi:hypothetical protein
MTLYGVVREKGLRALPGFQTPARIMTFIYDSADYI